MKMFSTLNPELTTVMNHPRFGLRILRKNPGLTAVVVLSLAGCGEFLI